MYSYTANITEYCGDYATVLGTNTNTTQVPTHNGGFRKNVIEGGTQ